MNKREESNNRSNDISINTIETCCVARSVRKVTLSKHVIEFHFHSYKCHGIRLLMRESSKAFGPAMIDMMFVVGISGHNI